MRKFVSNKLEYTDYYQSMFVRSRKLLVVLGLLNTCTDMKGVLIFDFLSRKWRLGTDMPCSRCYFACAPSSSEGFVYIAGGFHRKTFSPYLEAFVYNVEENKWDFLPAMSFDPNPCAGAYLDGKFYVVPLRRYTVQVYDSHTRQWKNIMKSDIEWAQDIWSGHAHSCVDSIYNRIYLEHFILYFLSRYNFFDLHSIQIQLSRC
ncbi:hypothetical protein SUGI_0084970 [Cryptomeria japonica]|nr:hypothetical protein SUGI_0084970 [Cryptomeria japonica]